MTNNICVDGEREAVCYSFDSIDFASEEQIFDILLDVLKSELPPRMAQVMDCEDKPMYITEEAIDLYPPAKATKFSLILNPLAQTPEYTPGFSHRIVTHDFELILTVNNRLLRCVTWELIRFKNIIEGLIVGAEFAIDGYNSVDVEVRGFTFYPPTEGETKTPTYRRQGSYRFAVTVSQYKI